MTPPPLYNTYRKQTFFWRPLKMFSFWEKVDTWQNFVIGALMANKVSWTSSFGKKISICMRKTKINLKGDWAWNTQKNNSFSKAPLLFSQVGLI